MKGKNSLRTIKYFSSSDVLNNYPAVLGSVHTALAIALALAMPKSDSLAIAVLTKEWVGMPYLSEILSENLSFSSLEHAIAKESFFGIAIANNFAKASVNGNLCITNVLMKNIC